MQRMKRLLAVFLIVSMMIPFAARAETAKNVTAKCKWIVSTGSAKKIHDDDMKTEWLPAKGKGELRIMVPESAAYVHIDWSVQPTDYVITEYDADRNVVATHTPETDSFPCISMLYTLDERTIYVFASFDQTKQGITEVDVYTAGQLPDTVTEWEAGSEKCDLMIISAHQDDEWVFFGAILPYYQLVQKKDVQLVYMTNCGRYRYAEALNGIAKAGISTYPFFLDLKDERIKSFDRTLSHWGGADHVVELLVATIRRYKPEVILTHDWDGEYGHNQHKVTSRAMEYAIEAAADPTRYPESYAQYGAWQVKKLYRHLAKDNVIAFDWHISYPEFGGKTALQLAYDCMEEHKTQKKYFHVEDHGKYDNSLFGLCYSTVGNDVQHNDLFENIPDTEEAELPLFGEAEPDDETDTEIMEAEQ